MNVSKTIGVMCLSFVFFSDVHASGIEFQSLSLDEALTKAKQENKHVFIDVYADWCGPCKYLAKEIFPDEKLGEFMNQHFVSIQLDGEQGDGLMLMGEFSLNAYPTMLFLSPEMELKKKIVGVVSPQDIQQSGNAVVFPESTAIYQLEKKYEAGDRSRETLKSYVIELINEDRASEERIDEFLKLYPQLSLKDEDDFIIFSMGITDTKNAYMKEFLVSAGKFKEMYGELADGKMEIILMGMLSEAIEKEDKSLLQAGLEEIYEPYKAVFGEQSLSKEKLLSALESNYESVF